MRKELTPYSTNSSNNFLQRVQNAAARLILYLVWTVDPTSNRHYSDFTGFHYISE